MKHLSEDLINRYIDNELDNKELSILKEHIKICDECLTKLKTHKLVDNQLKNLNTFSPSIEFTKKVMSLLNQAPLVKQRKDYKVRIVFISAIVLVSITIIYLIGNTTISSLNGNGSEWADSFNNSLNTFKNAYNKTFTGKNASIIGVIISFVIIVGSYFVYESHKNFKDKLKRLS